MRGRSLLAPAFVLLCLLPPAQASGEGLLGPGDTLDGLDDLATLGGGTSAGPEVVPIARHVEQDVCVDVNSIDDDPFAVVVIASRCTVVATVSVEFSEEGDLVVTIAFAYAGFGYSLVLECSDPRNLPKFGDDVFWGSCSPRQLTQGLA